MKNTKVVWTAVLVVVGVLVIWGIAHISKSPRSLISTSTYMCDGGKSISAAYYEGTKMAEQVPGEPPVPIGSVDVSFNGAATTTLKQTISADGARYGNADESLVFWSKGNTALIMKNNEMDLEYTNCTNVVASSSTPVVTKPSDSPGGAVACTMEALICPDGSGVGRGGPKCQFSVCPNQTSFTGELKQQGANFSLVVPAKAGVGMGVTYAMPLLFTQATSTFKDFVGKQVTATGAFTTGNTYKVATLALVQGDTTLGTLSVGETKFVNGITITVNKIVEDSRCPQNVQCIQAGQVLAAVTLRSDTDTDNVNISSMTSTPYSFGTFKVSLVEVAPLKYENVFPTVASYRLTFKVTK